MCSQVNARRIDIQFQSGDRVLLRLQPNRQASLARKGSHKRARRFYGHFQIIERIGAMAYRLQSPAMAKLHNVFHASKLKKFVGDPQAENYRLPEEFI